jgi:soluble cytochrome b562
VEAEMRAQLQDRVRSLMLERGISEQQARRVILQEQQARAFGAGVPAQFMSQLTFAKGLPNQGNNDVARRSLDELIAIRKALAEPMKPGRRMPAEPGIAK